MKKDEEEEFYFTEDGFTVMTEAFLLQRGYCCGNGCRHCPYDYKMVAEPRRSKLLSNRNEENRKQKTGERKTKKP